MQPACIAICALLGAGTLAANPAAEDPAQLPLAVDAVRSPFVMTGETVTVSVGAHLSVVEGQYDFRHVPRLDLGQASERCTFEFPVFAPKEIDSLDELTVLTQIKLRIGKVEFDPDDFGLLPANTDVRLPMLPEGTRVVLFIFRIPRSLLRDRVTLNIRYFQPYYHSGGKEISAYLPLLPDFEALKNELLYSRDDFTVEFGVVDAVRLRRLSLNQPVGRQTPELVKVRPMHGEVIAVEVDATGPR